MDIIGFHLNNPIDMNVWEQIDIDYNPLPDIMPSVGARQSALTKLLLRSVEFCRSFVVFFFFCFVTVLE